MPHRATHHHFAAASQASDFGCFVRVGHVATLAVTGHASFVSMVETIAVATRADRLALIRIKLDDLRADVIVELGHPDMKKFRALEERAIEGTPGALHTYSGDLLEKMTVLLGKTDTHADVLFMAGADPTMTELLATELSLIWETRKKGLVARHIGDPDLDDAPALPILSPENPYRLTSAEMRVCKSLADGLSTREITERLSCAMPTVRSHLRNIYSKTGLGGMLAVVHRLHAEQAVEG